MQTNSLRGQEAQIFYSAVTFRFLLDSLARPGKLNQLEYPTFLGDPPRYHSSAISTDISLNLYALGALWTLLDREVSFVLVADGRWLDQGTTIAPWLALRSGAAVSVPNAADFAFFCDGSSAGLLAELNVGNLLEPESSATAIYCIERLGIVSVSGRGEGSLEQEGNPDPRSNYLELVGPGIEGRRVISVVGLEEGEVSFIKATRRNYPLGIDIYLVDAVGQCVGLPRTTKVRFMQAES